MRNIDNYILEKLKINKEVNYKATLNEGDYALRIINEIHRIHVSLVKISNIDGDIITIYEEGEEEPRTYEGFKLNKYKIFENDDSYVFLVFLHNEVALKFLDLLKGNNITGKDLKPYFENEKACSFNKRLFMNIDEIKMKKEKWKDLLQND